MRLDDRLAVVETPTMLVWGAKDQLAPTHLARDLAERMSDAKLTVIEDAGHIPHIDQPHAVATAINRFLRSPHPSNQEPLKHMGR
jgi:2-hydroxy-6-oxonona-2,4-dienedioate hydrolase